MANLPSDRVILLRGILGPTSGTTSNVTSQKNNVIRISKKSNLNNGKKNPGGTGK
jgi:hypothetical protein